MSEDSIIHEVHYPYPIWTVWNALTTSESLAQWLMPNDFAPILGHRFTLQTAPRQEWNGIIACEVVLLDPPYCLAYTWRGGSNASWLDTLVTFTLVELEKQTQLRLEHSGFAATGAAGMSVRNLLDRGWKSHVLHEKLPMVLAQLADQS